MELPFLQIVSLIFKRRLRGMQTFRAFPDRSSLPKEKENRSQSLAKACDWSYRSVIRNARGGLRLSPLPRERENRFAAGLK